MSFNTPTRTLISWDVQSHDGTCATCGTDGQVHTVTKTQSYMQVNPGNPLKRFKKATPVGEFCFNCTTKQVS